MPNGSRVTLHQARPFGGDSSKAGEAIQRRVLTMHVRTVTAGLGAAILAGALSIGAAGSASADPAYCTSSNYGSNGVTSYCYTSAPGTEFRTVVTCHYTTPSGSVDSNNWYGSWRVQGDPGNSIATCGAGWGRFSKNTQTR